MNTLAGVSLLAVAAVHQWAAITMGAVSPWRFGLGVLSLLSGLWLLIERSSPWPWRLALLGLATLLACTGSEMLQGGCACNYVVPLGFELAVDSGAFAGLLWLSLSAPLPTLRRGICWSVLAGCLIGVALARATVPGTPEAEPAPAEIAGFDGPMIWDESSVVGRPFPWWDEIHADAGDIDTLKTGRRLLCLLRGDCGECVDHAREFDGLARSAKERSPGLLVAAIEIPSEAKLWASGTTPPGCDVAGTLNPARQWIVTTPRFIWLEEGVVERVDADWHAGGATPWE